MNRHTISNTNTEHIPFTAHIRAYADEMLSHRHSINSIKCSVREQRLTVLNICTNQFHLIIIKCETNCDLINSVLWLEYS